VVTGLFLLRGDRNPLATPVTATIYEGRVARIHVPGDALMYSSGPEHRDAAELQNIVNQLPNLKIYLGHPSVFPAEKSGQKIVGTVEAGRLDDDTAVARMSITDEEALGYIKAGTHELSLGYRCVLDADKYQRQIILDHLAIVDRARCGPTCAMRTDSEELVMQTSLPESIDWEKLLKTLEAWTQTNDDAMSATTKVKCDKCGEMYDQGTDHTCKLSDGEITPAKSCTCKNHAMLHNNGEPMSDTNKDTELQGKLDAALAEIATLKNKATTLEVDATNARKDADALKTKLDAAEAEAAKVKSDAEAAVTQAKTDAAEAIKTEIDARVKARVALVTEASKLVKDVDFSAMSDRDIKVAVIKHVDGDEIPADKPELFVDGVYSGALKRGSAAAGSREAVRTAVNEMRKDNAPLKGVDAEKAARESMHRESALAWTK
jgi:hypothetical protein